MKMELHMSKREIYEYIKALINKSNFLKNKLDKIGNDIYDLREYHPEKDDIADDFEATVDALRDKILKIDEEINEVEVRAKTWLDINREEAENLQILFERLEHLEAKLEDIESEILDLEDELVNSLEE